jgi:hypothetical protein
VANTSQCGKHVSENDKSKITPAAVLRIASSLVAFLSPLVLPSHVASDRRIGRRTRAQVVTVTNCGSFFSEFFFYFVLGWTLTSLPSSPSPLSPSPCDHALALMLILAVAIALSIRPCRHRAVPIAPSALTSPSLVVAAATLPSLHRLHPRVTFTLTAVLPPSRPSSCFIQHR